MIGFFSLLWFLIRVVPKPGRASYPCQRAAFPLATGFILWLTGVLGSLAILRKVSKYYRPLLAVLMVVGVVIAGSQITSPTEKGQDSGILGIAQGIHPGRVIWAHDPLSTRWDGSAGHWWDEASIDQERVDSMLSLSIRELAGQKESSRAWDAIFRSFNESHGRGSVGYAPGEKVLLKINLNNQNNPYAAENSAIDALPQMVLAALKQLVDQAGIAQSDIIVLDALRPISDPVHDLCSAAFPHVQYIGGFGFFEDSANQRNLENKDLPWADDVVRYSGGNIHDPNAGKVPQLVLDSEYLINMAILKSHGYIAGISLTGKNHYGLIGAPEALHYHTEGHHRGMDTYAPQVDLMGHKDLGGKTLLYIIDGFYGTRGRNGVLNAPERWQSAPFNGHWPSSLFVSQDSVAIDSVGHDFLRAEISDLQQNADRYLHEAATADNPASGVKYDPEGDGTILKSLGVHEHWNNAADKEYSRNLDPVNGIGIELIPLRM